MGNQVPSAPSDEREDENVGLDNSQSHDGLTSQTSLSSNSSHTENRSLDDPYTDDGGGEASDGGDDSECYRVPIFNKLEDPLTTPDRPLSPVNLGADGLASVIRSIANCYDRVTADTSLASSSLPDAKTANALMGCVPAPLSRTVMEKTNSWTNLMGLDDDSELAYTSEELDLPNGEEPTPESDLSPHRKYWIVTTAALPWMTGTAVNPLLRSAYLSQRNRSLRDDGKSSVTLVLPWLESSEDRLTLYGADWEDSTPEDQEAFIRAWLRDSAGMPLEAALPSEGGIEITWYAARYHVTLSSIFAMGDLCEVLPEDEEHHDMICILEEPEHVNFYRAPGRWNWRDKFSHVIGIVHTNYKAYAKNHYSGILTGPLVGAMSSLMVRAYCDKVIKLSPVLQTYAPYKEVVSNVHGIRQEFFEAPLSPTANKCYFIGKLLWAKGLDKLLDLEACYKKATGSYWPIDIFGSGPQQDEIQQAFLGQDYDMYQRQASTNSEATTSPDKNEKDLRSADPRRYWRRFRQPIPAQFLGRQDHARIGDEYKIFINPSITEVLCTTTAEAIAMGKWAIVPKHASNEFFLPFHNCLQYSSRHEFVQLLQHAMDHDPPCMSMEQPRTELYQSLSWLVATDRLIEAAHLTRRDAKRSERLQPLDKGIQEWHYTLFSGPRGDVLRRVMGGGPVAEQSQYASNQSANEVAEENANDSDSMEEEDHATPSAPSDVNHAQMLDTTAPVLVGSV